MRSNHPNVFRMPSRLEVFEDIWRTRLRSAHAEGYRPGTNLRVDEAVRVAIPGKRLLDIGCGAGTLAAAIKDRYEEVYGIDVAEEALAVARANGVTTTRLDVSTEQLPYAAGMFDVIAVLAVLPYVHDPRGVLSECHRVLRPNGQLLLSMANMRTLAKLFRLFVIGKFPASSKEQSAAIDGGAMHYFCGADMVQLLESTGFAVTNRRGLFCRPTLMSYVPDRWPVIGHLKREFFAGEIFLSARRLEK